MTKGDHLTVEEGEELSGVERGKMGAKVGVSMIFSIGGFRGRINVKKRGKVL